MKKIITLLIFSLVTVSACKENNEVKASENISTLQLDNGKKWRMNAEMKAYIQKTEYLLNSYDGKSDYRILARDLSETNDHFLKSCPIKETTRQVMHEWLMPLIEKTDKLAKAEGEYEQAIVLIGDLKNSIRTYHQYFE